jgi:hypothetical protein
MASAASEMAGCLRYFQLPLPMARCMVTARDPMVVLLAQLSWTLGPYSEEDAAVQARH